MKGVIFDILGMWNNPLHRRGGGGTYEFVNHTTQMVVRKSAAGVANVTYIYSSGTKKNKEVESQLYYDACSNNTAGVISWDSDVTYLDINGVVLVNKETPANLYTAISEGTRWEMEKIDGEVAVAYTNRNTGYRTVRIFNAGYTTASGNCPEGDLLSVMWDPDTVYLKFNNTVLVDKRKRYTFTNETNGWNLAVVGVEILPCELTVQYTGADGVIHNDEWDPQALENLFMYGNNMPGTDVTLIYYGLSYLEVSGIVVENESQPENYYEFTTNKSSISIEKTGDGSVYLGFVDSVGDPAAAIIPVSEYRTSCERGSVARVIWGIGITYLKVNDTVLVE